MKNRMNVGILGAGNIARAMATALNGIPSEACAYAVASRDLKKAEDFAKEWQIGKAYGSYEELVSDPDIDLIYVATPHSFHFEHAKLAVEHGKAVLVEKPFTPNEAQAKELFALAKEKNVLITEAMWTRYLPAQDIIKDLMNSGIIGEVQSLKAEFSEPLAHVARLREPTLAGGALLDIGIYALTFASMYFGDDIVECSSTCEKYETGVDGTEEIFLTYRDGKTAKIRSTFTSNATNEATIYGAKGNIYVKDLHNYSEIKVYDLEGNCVKTCEIPAQVNGYEYEVLSCKRALCAGALECEELPHEQTLILLRQMDELRKEWGVIYPFE